MKKNGKNIILYVAGLIILFVILVSVFMKDEKVVTKTDAQLDYKLEDKIVSDTPGNVKISLAYRIRGEYNEKSLKTLAEYLLNEAKKETGFETFKHPQMATVYIYPSNEKIEKLNITFGGNYLISAHSRRERSETASKYNYFDYKVKKLDEIEQYGGFMDQDGPTMPSVYSQEWVPTEIYINEGLLQRELQTHTNDKTFQTEKSQRDTDKEESTKLANKLDGPSEARIEKELPVLIPYELFKNPFLYKNQRVKLNPINVPMLINNWIVKFYPGSPKNGLVGLRYNRMISEDQAIYEIIIFDMQKRGVSFEPVGEMLVFLHMNPNERTLGYGPLSYEQLWEVEPLGQIQGTNAFGGSISIPAVRFWGYAREVVNYEENKVKKEADEHNVPDQVSENKNVQKERQETDNVSYDADGFVKRYLSALSDGDLEKLISLYDEEVNYYQEGIVDKDFILQDKKYFYNRWPIAKYTLVNYESILSKNNLDLIEAKFITDYLVENTSTGKKAKGVAENILVLKKENGELKIVEENQFIIKRDKYDSEKTEPIIKSPDTEVSASEKAYNEEFETAVQKYIDAFNNPDPLTPDFWKNSCKFNRIPEHVRAHADIISKAKEEACKRVGYLSD